MIAVGLDPTDNNMDPTSPVGLGNVVCKRLTDCLLPTMVYRRIMNLSTLRVERIVMKHRNNMGVMWNKWKPSFSGSSRFQGIREGIVAQQKFVSPSLGVFSFFYENNRISRPSACFE